MSTDPYPTEEELKRIEEWDFKQGFKPLMDYVKSLWWMSDWGWHEGMNDSCFDAGCTFKYGVYDHDDKDTSFYYQISTGGWSGNEELINAMSKNYLFWSVCWRTSRAGGHFRFQIPPRLAEADA